MAGKSPLVVFSHLRWNFVYQRPQHVLSRMAKNRPIIFVEEPKAVAGIENPRWELSVPAMNVTVMVPNLPENGFAPGFQSPQMMRLIHGLADSKSLSRPLVWTYTPSAIDLIEGLDPALLVYDCMDELSAFLHAPAELRDQERRLLQRADLVFTGGPSLYRSKKSLHSQVHCFPSSVDVAHFQQAGLANSEAADQAAIPGPRLGFFGVIDERLDVELLREVASQRPEWQIVLVGPVVKIDPATLPDNPNIHYFGSREYAQLPSYIKGWDVGIMPFAMNDATKFISPTKVLEYMAADKPIVSTPITDVAEPYGSFVRIASGAGEFVRQCEAALNASAEDWAERRAAAENVLAQTSWDKTANSMETVIEQTLSDKRRNAITAPYGSKVTEKIHRIPVLKREPVMAGSGSMGMAAASRAD